MTSLIYDVYSNRDVRPDQTNLDHIIPLSLGGIDAFSVGTLKDFNSHLGSEVDGRMANDFLIQHERNRYEVKGHSGKVPRPTAKQSEIVETKRTVQASFDKEGLHLWDPRTKEYLGAAETLGVKVKSTIVIDSLVRMRFTAKVGLGAGYFVYGDLFRRHVCHDDLRAMMTFKSVARKEALSNIRTRYADGLLGGSREGRGYFMVFQKLPSVFKTMVALVPSRDNLLISVGTLGTLIGVVVVPAETKDFPKRGLHDLGCVCSVGANELQQISFRTAVRSLGRYLGTPNLP